MKRIIYTLVFVLSTFFAEAQQRYTDFTEAMNDYKRGKIGVERFPYDGYTSMFEFESFVLKQVQEDYCNLIHQKLEDMINHGNGGIVFKYEMKLSKQGDFLVPQTFLTGPFYPTEAAIMNGVEYKVMMKLNPSQKLPDSLYVAKISMPTVINKFDQNNNGISYAGCDDMKLKSALRDFIKGIYMQKYKAGDKVSIGNISIRAKIDFSSSDTLWAYDLSKRGYPDYKSIRESHNADSLKEESYWFQILTKADFVRDYLYPKQEGGSVFLEKKHTLKVKTDETDSTKLKWDILWKKDDEFDRYMFLFKEQSKPAFKSENNWYSAVGRDVEVLYKIFIHNNMAQFERERFSAEYKEKEAERLELEKQELANKYGRKYVDALYNLTIIVGMPEDLVNVIVNQLYTVGTASSSVNGNYYRLDPRYGTGWVSVWIKDKVVTAVTYH